MESKLNTYRKSSVMAGAMIILSVGFMFFAASIGGECFVQFILGQPMVSHDILFFFAANSAQLSGGALFTIMIGTSLIAMTVFLYSIFKKDSEGLAMGMVLFYGVMQGIWYCVMAIVIFSLIALGKEYIVTGADVIALESVGKVLSQLLYSLGEVSLILFLIGAACLFIFFYRTRLIPRWLTVWGLIGVLLSVVQTNTNLDLYLKMVLVPQEIIMGIWLIAKGFNPGAIAVIIKSAWLRSQLYENGTLQNWNVSRLED